MNGNDAASAYSARPWLALYEEGKPATLTPGQDDVLAVFRAAVARAPDRPAAIYFDARLTYAELDRLSDALAALLVAEGFRRGDRLAVFLQNVPQFPLGVLAAWKAGGIAVPINPMNREREVGLLFSDCRPKALVAHDDLYAQVIAKLAPEVPLPLIRFTTSALDLQTRNDARLFRDVRRLAVEGARDLLATLAQTRVETPPETAPAASSDVAFIVYTSGTTGLPKGVMNTHGNVAANARVNRDWWGIAEGAPILALAPLFHVTGLVAHMALSWTQAAPMILACRFEAGAILDAIAEHRPAFTVSAITAFIALMHHPEASRERFAGFTRLVSGGAPIPPSVVDEFQDKFGFYIHNGYGMTETSAPTHSVPVGRRAPVDPLSGSLSIGVPLFGVAAWIADEAGRPAPVGEIGELVVSGPSVSPGYWNKPAETAEAMRPDGFRTGDVGFMDKEGWFYLVDRKKDMINASGFKVWPREVEDVLYAHPAVREAAVVGVPDAYRGETVRGFVSLKPGASANGEDLVAWCRERMAAYKYPRSVEILAELPKTPTGKILRRMLR